MFLSCNKLINTFQLDPHVFLMFQSNYYFSSWTHMFFSCFKCGGGQDSDSLSSAGSDSDDEDDEDGGDESGKLKE